MNVRFRRLALIGAALGAVTFMSACAYNDYGYRNGYDGYRHHSYDRDDNPPGPVGGPGTNWENPPGPRGGPGASPDRPYRRY